MDVEFSESHLKNSSDLILKAKRKTPMRHRFEAEVDVIEREIGGLDEARRKLGLSQRAISQLLLVDPSAWTRWNSGKTKAPPHVFRMLEWYFIIKEKHPSLAARFYESRSFSDEKQLARIQEATETSTKSQKVFVSSVQDELMFLRDQQRKSEEEKAVLVARIDKLQSKAQTLLWVFLSFFAFVVYCLVWLNMHR